MKMKFVILSLIILFIAPVAQGGELSRQNIVVNKTLHTITFYDYVKKSITTYPVGTGRIDKPTKEGDLHIARKYIDPTWNPLNPEDYEGQYGKGWPKPPYTQNHLNPLGTRFMALSWEDYGIHGTKEPSLIGRNVSSGCVRMNIPDVEMLFPMVSVGAKVTIKSEDGIPQKLAECFSSWWGVYNVFNIARRIRVSKGD